jgi:hypothetical protein
MVRRINKTYCRDNDDGVLTIIKGTCSNWRQEAEEEVVEGQGYVTSQHSYRHLSPSWSYPWEAQLQRLLLS